MYPCFMYVYRISTPDFRKPLATILPFQGAFACILTFYIPHFRNTYLRSLPSPLRLKKEKNLLKGWQQLESALAHIHQHMSQIGTYIAV